MAIYLMRHGKPVPKTDNPEKPLSPDGRRDVEIIADFLLRHGVRFQQVYHSGKSRAKETAEIMGSRLGTDTEPKARNGSRS